MKSYAVFSSIGKGYQTLQFTLVDCPGHASLIKTVIGGKLIVSTRIT